MGGITRQRSGQDGVTLNGAVRRTVGECSNPRVASLVVAARRGDAAAWEGLYRVVHPQLLAYARHALGNADDAREAVSETMARAVAGIGKLSVDAHFTAWVHGILRYVVIDMHRANDRTRAARDDHELDDVISLDAEPAEVTLAGEEAADMRAAFAALPAADREVLALRVVAGLSAEDVAAVLGKRAGAVRMAQSRALGKLRMAMESTAR